MDTETQAAGQADKTAASDTSTENTSAIENAANQQPASLGGGEAPAASTLPEAYMVDGKPNMEAVTQALSRVPSDIPAEGEDYTVTLPEDLGLKDDAGAPLQFDASDPFVGEFIEIAKADGLGQGTVNKLIGMYGKMVKTAHTGNADQIAAQQTAEFALLDSDRGKAEARAAEASNGLKAVLGDDATPIIDGMTTAAAVIAVEKLLELVGGELSGTPGSHHKGDGRKSNAEVFYPTLKQ